jgi:hypothetical protein
MPITTPTVLILGAGASRPHGFPLGRELRDIVCRLLEKPGLFIELGHSEMHVRAFRDELRFSAYRSVDQFLERNEAFLAIGKQAIAAALLPAENEDRLFSPGAPGEHWYELLVDRMAVDTDDWFKNRLFNRDNVGVSGSSIRRRATASRESLAGLSLASSSATGRPFRTKCFTAAGQARGPARSTI